jgi:hypothetical protein
MNWLSRINATARILGASYQIIMAGLTIFYTVRMSIHWDKPQYRQHHFHRRLPNETQPKVRSFKPYKRFRRKN